MFFFVTKNKFIDSESVQYIANILLNFFISLLMASANGCPLSEGISASITSSPIPREFAWHSASNLQKTVHKINAIIYKN